MDITLIISYYKNIPNLKLILKALNEQSYQHFEVIISEDDNNPETSQFVAKNRSKYNFPIQHLQQQEDLGFRKNMMLNKSIKAAKGETIVFIDGDCVPHKHFIKAYKEESEPGKILQGRRVILDEKVSSKALETQQLGDLNYWKLLFTKSRKLKEGLYLKYFSLAIDKKGLLGCNWGIRKEELYKVNGFDEDYVNPGAGEDVDIDWRLKKAGLRTWLVKNKAIVYHLYHKRSYREKLVQDNVAMMHRKQKENHFKCLNGIKKLSTV
jgi:GT2 family glycosyltransferase